MMMRIKPLVSVIMSVFNEREEWLKESIDSILNQSFRDLEFIIICDNPQYQKGIAILKGYKKKDDRIKLIFNEENIGLTASLNKGLSIAEGEYIARMDADDVSSIDRLQRQLDYMQEHPDVDVCGTNCKLIGDIGLLGNRYFILPEKHEEIIHYMLFSNPIAHPTAFMKRVIRGYGVSYDESKRKAQDYQLWYDLRSRGAFFHNIQENLLCYRISSSQISSTGRFDQNQVSNCIHADLLREMGYDSERTILMHNEICNFIQSEISVDEKLDWLNMLYYNYAAQDSRCLRDLYLFLSCQVCFKNKKPVKVMSIKQINLSVLRKLYFYKGLVSCFVRKNRK